jgi:hypothetical protein
MRVARIVLGGFLGAVTLGIPGLAVALACPFFRSDGLSVAVMPVRHSDALCAARFAVLSRPPSLTGGRGQS